MKFAVIDLETTGLNPVTDRITEIGIVFIEDHQATGKFESLFNPGVSIPLKISLLTGINNQLVKDQPAFEDLAEQINELTKGIIIIGHRVNFDYSFLKNEMRRVGIAFSRQILCTAELASILYPKMKSYSLASLCKFHEVQNSRPHRALPDADATARIFLKMVTEKGTDFINSIYQPNSRFKLIPPHLRETVYKRLPSKTGVYYFIGLNNKPIYIGKATKIKGRVLSHFRGEGNSLKILAITSKIKEIRFRETGSELLASLLEDHEIRHYWPELNAAQKMYNKRFGIIYYQDQKNQWRIGITKSGKKHLLNHYFHQYHLAIEFISEQVKLYNLNSALCGLPNDNGVSPDEHHINFDKMLKNESSDKTVQLYFTNGRTEEEQGFIWFENGQYKGFGFTSDKETKNLDHLRENLQLSYSSVTTENILSELKLREAALVVKLK